MDTQEPPVPTEALHQRKAASMFQSGINRTHVGNGGFITVPRTVVPDSEADRVVVEVSDRDSETAFLP
mgnify:CR=1 FL=1